MVKIIGQIDNFLLKAEKKQYVQPQKGEKIPKGVLIQEGPRRGKFYTPKRKFSVIDFKKIKLQKLMDSWDTEIKSFGDIPERLSRRMKVSKSLLGSFNIDYLENFAEHLDTIFAAYNNKVVGGIVGIGNFQSPNEYHLSYLFTSPENIKGEKLQGTGSFLIYKMFSWILKNKPEIENITLIPSDDACKFYQRIGFKPISRLHMDYIITKDKIEKFVESYEKEYG